MKDRKSRAQSKRRASRVAIPAQLPEADESAPAKSPSIESFARASGITLSAALKRRLTAAKVRTVEHLSASDVVAREDDAATLTALRHHATLAGLGLDHQARALLERKGFASVSAIAEAPRSDVVRTLSGLLGDLGAAELYLKTKAYHALAGNAGVGAAVEAAMSSAERCGCQDCESAVSPAAYLADLMDYALKHVRIGASTILIQTLEDTFCQPFGKLPVDCEAVDERIRQVRLAVEILRRFLVSTPPSAFQVAPLAAGEKAYRALAYNVLLTQLGTSYDEVRGARTAAAATRVALAERLGLYLSAARPDGLDNLFRDPDADAPDPTAIREDWLESMFGLVDTTRDPFLPGGTPEWIKLRLTRLRDVWGALDRPAQEVLRHFDVLVDPDVINPGDFQNPVSTDVAFARWSTRHAWATGQFIVLQTMPLTAAGFDTRVTSVLGVGTAPLVVLGTRDADGEDIAADLEAAGLRRAELLAILRFKQILDQGLPPLVAEWTDVENLLVQVLKRGQYATWRTEEAADGIVLAPDTFRLPAAGAPEPTLASWRATLDQRWEWQETLKARIEQEKEARAELDAAVGGAETAGLPLLRDNLVDATDADGMTTEARKLWVSRRLLIDAGMGSCQITTRTALAMEVLQILLFSLYNGAFKTGPVALRTWELMAERFDEEWKWLGTYSDWRSAMLVFLYPQNVMLPSLKRPMTGAFRGLINELRSAARLLPGQACAAAARYADYFHDVCTLGIQATCCTQTRIYKPGRGCTDPSTPVYRPMFYQFSSIRGIAYWSVYDPLTSANMTQTFWEPIPGVKNVQMVIGAVPHGEITSQRHIYVFLMTGTPGALSSLVLTRYNLDTLQWTGEVITLDLPEQVPWSAVVKQYEAERMEPHLAIQCGPWIYERKLKWGGVGWADGVWLPIQKYTPSGSPVYLWQTPVETRGMLQIRAMVAEGAGDAFFLVMEDNEAVWILYYHPGYFNPNHVDATIPKTMLWYTFGTMSKLVGASFRTHSSEMIVWLAAGPARWWVGVQDQTTWVIYHGGMGSPDVGFVAPLNGYDPDSYTSRSRLFGYTGAGGPMRCRFRRQTNHYLSQSATMHMTPQVSGPFLVTNGLSTTELQARAGQIKAAFTANLPAGSSIVAYLEEMYFLVPMQIGVLLMQSGDYPRALDWFRIVYDYTQPEAQRPIYYGLVLEESRPEAWNRSADWLLDPLNPHLIGATRKLSCTRYTLQTIITCLLDYADSEFTHDTAESLERARTLYLMALALLESYALSQAVPPCDDVIGGLSIDVSPPWEGPYYDLLDQLRRIQDVVKLTATVTAIKAELESDRLVEERFSRARTVVKDAMSGERPTLGRLLNGGSRTTNGARVTVPALSAADDLAVSRFASTLRGAVSSVTGVRPESLTEASLPFLRQPARTMSGEAPGGFDIPDPPAPFKYGDAVTKLDPNAIVSIDLWFPYVPYVPTVRYEFCIPPNPMLRSLRLRAELNLRKLRTCRNITGTVREVDVYSAPTDVSSLMPMIAGGRLVLPGAQRLRPTPYKYAILIDRAKQTTSLAAQVEASMLSSLEKRDAEAYSMLRAQQDMDYAQAQVRLGDLKVTQAQDGVRLAELQREQAEIRVDTYSEWLAEGLSDSEQESLDALADAVDLSNMSAYYLMGAAAAHGTQSAITSVVTLGLGGAGELGASLGAMAGALSSRAQAKSTESSRLAMQASFERRQNEWTLQRNIAQQDVRIGRQQEVLAQTGVEVATQERAIATLQAEHAGAVVQFLSNKFTNTDLYDWMAGILEGVYSYFLQQATATALLAHVQLAFERQEPPPPFIQNDYWLVPDETAAPAAAGQAPADRKGLTGSARLLQDIFRLDQYAFESSKRRLQLTRTISLAQLAPLEFQQFRERGVLPFSLTSELFDRDFPGHYLRLIRRVRASIIALVPPNQGVRAELFHSGLSRVVTKGEAFAETLVRRDPETMAFTLPIGAGGVFEQDPQPELLLPFEGLGVDGQWKLSLPKASNFMDYATIADVLLTIDYTALADEQYRQQVLQHMPRRLSAERPLSFRHHLADAWYDLHNPDQTATPMTVMFETRRQDFPPNLDDLRIEHVVLYFARATGVTVEVPVTHLQFTPAGTGVSITAGASTMGGVVSTRRSNGTGWLGMLQQTPIGQWELALPNTPAIRNVFEKERVEDILFVLTYGGRTAPWPA